MAATNAFDLLILPVLQWSGGIYATFALIRLALVGFARLFGTSEQPPEVDLSRGSAFLEVRRPVASRHNRRRVRAMSPSR